MTEPLIDSEGYPRSDIDVYQVRHARHQIKCKCLEPVPSSFLPFLHDHSVPTETQLLLYFLWNI